MANLNIKKTSQQVKYILDNFPQTRDSDKLLYVVLAEYFYGCSDLRDVLDPKVPTFETVRRVRQKFQEQGLFLATPGVRVARGVNQIKMKAAMKGKLVP